MSQTTFLESVVGWDHQKCLQNLDEALPKLIVSFNYLEYMYSISCNYYILENSIDLSILN